MDWYSRSSEAEDQVFAWQRIAGVNPMVIKRAAERLPDHFPVSAEIYAKVVAGDTLDSALSEGRLFLADYALLDGAQTSDKKLLYAPLALFAWRAPSEAMPDGGLVPVAIQCGQTPGKEFPIWTPHDGYRWKMARQTVQIADGNHHQAVAHLGRTHMVMEPFVLSACRQLAPNHPIAILLESHSEFTLAINNTAAHSLIAPGGAVEEVLAGTLETSIALAASPLASFEVATFKPHADLTARGLMDLPMMPYRDDTLPLWDAIYEWVGSYLRLYYRTDGAVAADVELQAWVGEVQSPSGGRLRSLKTVATIAELVDLVALLVWTASAQHAAVNFPQFDFIGYVPNMAGAAFAPAPVAETPDTEASWVAMMSPMSNACVQFDTVFQLSMVRMGILGEYGSSTFADEHVQQYLARFQTALKDAEAASIQRDGKRLMSYPWLRSSLVTTSIHI